MKIQLYIFPDFFPRKSIIIIISISTLHDVRVWSWAHRCCGAACEPEDRLVVFSFLHMWVLGIELGCQACAAVSISLVLYSWTLAFLFLYK